LQVRYKTATAQLHFKVRQGKGLKVKSRVDAETALPYWAATMILAGLALVVASSGDSGRDEVFFPVI